MAYSFQTFTLNQILTAAQMNQVEVNIRDHQHGVSGVDQSVGAAPTASGHYVNKGYADQFLHGRASRALDYVVGRIDTTGTSGSILTGSGFSIASKVATGRVLMALTTSMTGLPVILVTAEGGIGAVGDVRVNSIISQQQWTMERLESVTDTDGIIDFQVIGPQ